MDFANLKTLTIPQGEVTKITSGSTVLWEAVTYTNQVPISTDTDGSIYNGCGYKNGVRLSGTSGNISGSTQTGSVTTGFIPIDGANDVMRMKGVQWKSMASNTSQHYYFCYYDANKKFLVNLEAMSHANSAHVVTVTRDSNGIETVVWNKDYGTSNTMLQSVRSASFVRITAYGDGADMIVTLNEEIT